MILQKANNHEMMGNTRALLKTLASLKKTFAVSLCIAVVSAAVLYFIPTASAAGNLDINAFTVKINPDGTSDYALSLQVVILMGLLSFIPSILVMMTSFTRIVIVISILRQAIGLQAAPSNQVVVGIALFMTVFVMTPVFDDMYTTAIEPYMEEKIEAREAFSLAQKPLHKFMITQTRLTDLNAFSEYANVKIDKLDDVPMRVVIPAFIISELKTAFQIGFMLFLPFLIIDLVVASILMAMGMMMLSPMIVSLPFKLMLFVLVDGWSLIMGTLMTSFGIGVGGT
ncbi:flagellar type III secretion system pore protein FliP [Succinivibrio dextrinosolvens]|jgi:flagellar biosynthetic protein FliP|uniref:flagellar type III secretion system pore protein FliP n=2 Tax=Succinivibrio dextrinosolvens TaxID=83771 RepID=UPI00241E5EA6|nr:flagellar type III secretion system pore protein FliP [Succinivibrio dextrinosolvens]